MCQFTHMCSRKESLQQEVLSYAKEEESQSNKEFGESGCTRARAHTHTHILAVFSAHQVTISCVLGGTTPVGYHKHFLNSSQV